MKVYCKRLANRMIVIGETTFSFDEDGLASMTSPSKRLQDLKVLSRMNGVKVEKPPEVKVEEEIKEPEETSDQEVEREEEAKDPLEPQKAEIVGAAEIIKEVKDLDPDFFYKEYGVDNGEDS